MKQVFLPTTESATTVQTFSEPGWRTRAFGPLTLHRLVIVLLLSGIVAGLLYSFQTLWPDAHSARSILEMSWTTGHILWVAGVPAFLGGLGLLLYRRSSLQEIHKIDNIVVYRVVSRGDNVLALLGTVQSIQETMRHTPIFPYRIEVVTEEGYLGDDIIPLDLAREHVTFMHVPRDYVLPNRTGFKARALEYALHHSSAPDTAWLVHLDEESHPSRSCVLGVAKMISEEECTGQLRIGQGAILYHRLWKKHPFWTLLDSVRTGQDFGPFFLQTRLGISLYGFHGSYIVIRNDVEKQTGGFDLGVHGHITEDAWWILVANSKGHKIRWVEGYVEEQSVQSLTDYMKQRGRWFYGLREVVRHAPVSQWRRLPLRLNLLLWMFVWVSVPYSTIHFFFGFAAHPVVLTLAVASWAAYAVQALAGLWVNLRARDDTGGFLGRLVLVILQLLLVPVYCLMEMWAAFWHGVLRPSKSFHVIKK